MSIFTLCCAFRQKLNALQTSLEETQGAKKAIESKLEWTESQLEEIKSRFDELNKQMNSVSSSGKGNFIISDNLNNR